MSNLAGIMDAYQSMINTKTTKHGIKIANFSNFNDEATYPLTADDRAVFQMSASAFWIPEFVQSTLSFINKYNLWPHPEFAPYQALMTSPGDFGETYESLESVTRGAVITDIETVLYKDGPVMLLSMQDYNFMYLGRKQFPYVATSGLFAVYGRSGSSEDFLNIHMPKVR